jgi:competence protein ComEA
MSDLLPELPRPDAPLSWRERLRRGAESLDLTPVRLVVGLVVLSVASFAAWRLLAPPSLPAEMGLPMVSTSAGGDGGGGGGASESAAGGDGGGSSGSTATSVPTGVVVHVAGAVATPGVQRLGADARVIDAVDAAGGAQPDADLARVNLAAPLEDGQQVYVPRVGEAAPAPPAGAVGSGSSDGSGPGGGGAGGDSASGPVNLNTAGIDELDSLPGVGPAIAQAILDHREQIGRFATVDDLLDVRGIGESKLEQIRDLVTV